MYLMSLYELIQTSWKNLIINGFLRNVEKIIIRWIHVDRDLPIQLDITNSCNLNCLHCYHTSHSNHDSLNLKQWIIILNQYEKLINRLGYKPHVILCGGEPFTSHLLESILNEICSRKINYKVTIITNGT